MWHTTVPIQPTGTCPLSTEAASLRIATCCLSVEWVRQGNVYLEVCACAVVRDSRHCVILLALSGLSSMVLAVWGVRWCGETIMQREKHEVRHEHSLSKLSWRAEPVSLELPGLFFSCSCWFLCMSFGPDACRRCHILWTVLVDDSRLPCGCLELNPDPPQEQPVLQTLGCLSLQPLFLIYVFNSWWQENGFAE